MGAHQNVERYANGIPVKPADGLRRMPSREGNRTVHLKDDHPAVREGRTIYPHSRKFVEEVGRVLKSGMNSPKTGAEVMKGHWRGFPIFTLTLEERATCPRTCKVWNECYGNKMNWAERIVHDADFEDILWLELEALNKAHPLGFVVRLHILGDFYSEAYVALWGKALLMFPALNVFGYTARDPDLMDPIGVALKRLSDHHWSRFAMRFSGKKWGLQGVVTVEPGAKPKDAIVCPAQTGATACCGTCGLCWTTRATIAFEKH